MICIKTFISNDVIEKTQRAAKTIQPATEIGCCSSRYRYRNLLQNRERQLFAQA